MEKCKKLLILLFACALAVGLLTACGGGGGSAAPSLPSKDEELSALNEARTKVGQSTLTRSELLDTVAAEELDAYISWKVKDEMQSKEYYARRQALYYKIESQGIDGQTVYVAVFEEGYRTWPASGTWSFLPSDKLVTQEADYAGNAIKAVDGTIYCSIVTARRMQADSGTQQPATLLDLVNEELQNSGELKDYGITLTADASLNAQAQQVAAQLESISNLKTESPQLYGLDPDKVAILEPFWDGPLTKQAEHFAMRIVELKLNGATVEGDGKRTNKTVSQIRSLAFAEANVDGKSYIIGLVSFDLA